ncbi:hypothetical protein NA56DRAFT_172073 [Hyaloscypha hepaticicola]|uniref:Uncharacterized protein n=1 Tax=Hyaloscypha hepaticicola TaxID=2082293 RepID=A0A2J6Q348_9HELO|nr:hypothetical protein NA56DRAFT_172073 [Hyaloscypha hepaticicola]
MFEMIGLVGAAALRCQLAGCRGYCGVTRIGIRNTYLVLFLVCEIVSVFYVFFCLFVPLFNFCFSNSSFEVWVKGLKILERTWLSLSFHCQPSFLVLVRIYGLSEKVERDSGKIDGRLGL